MSERELDELSKIGLLIGHQTRKLDSMFMGNRVELSSTLEFTRYESILITSIQTYEAQQLFLLMVERGTF